MLKQSSLVTERSKLLFMKVMGEQLCKTSIFYYETVLLAITTASNRPHDYCNHYISVEIK
jgi:hypothetical protein